MLETERGRASVMGPAGPLSVGDLPVSSNAYWTNRRKAEVLAAIDGGLLDLNDACSRYRLSREEVAAWRRLVDRAGIPGLRVTAHRRRRSKDE